jgi:hypothetical protein
MTMPIRVPEIIPVIPSFILSWMLATCLVSCTANPPTPHQGVAEELASRVASEPVLDILFVGNSYSFKVPAAFAKEASARKMKVKVGQVTHGGWTLRKHTKSEETLTSIRSGKWDVIVFQEQSRIPSQSAMRSLLMAPSLRFLVDEARQSGAIPILYQTWGYREGDPKVKGDDFFAMNRRVRDGYLASSREVGGLLVIPAGDAWEREARKGRLAELFMPDGSHPSGKGNALTAATFVDALKSR